MTTPPPAKIIAARIEGGRLHTSVEIGGEVFEESTEWPPRLGALDALRARVSKIRGELLSLIVASAGGDVAAIVGKEIQADMSNLDAILSIRETLQ